MNAKFDGRLPDDSVNLPKSHPLKEAATLFIAVAALAGGLFFLVGWGTEKAVMSMSVETEVKLLDSLKTIFEEQADVKTSSVAKRVSRVFWSVAEQWEDPPYKFMIKVTPGPPNAFALPGGGIIVTTGLVEELESENELAFILGHELGHFKNRDHLKGLSRQLSFFLVKVLVMNTAGVGVNSEDIFSMMGDLSSKSWGRKQELAADRFGLELVHKGLGHVAGTTTFFERRMKDESSRSSRLGKYLSTHPASKERIKKMKKIAEEEGYVRTGTITMW